MYTLHNLNIKRSETTKFTSRLLNTPADQNFWVARLTAYSISQGPQEPYQGENQGCQTVYFLTKNPKLGIFWRALEW
jgi:hypothetical protein